MLKESVCIINPLMVKQIQLHVYHNLYAKFPEFEKIMSHSPCLGL